MKHKIPPFVLVAYYTFVVAVIGVIIFILTGCSTIKLPDAPREPVDPATVPLAGEYTPDPVLVRYEFEFSDGATLVFRENHMGDYWGYYPSGGWGEITDADGNTRGVYVNKIVRHGGLHKAETPVTTPDHGTRMFWMADVEETPDAKRVTIFEDGWNPLVEGAVLATQTDLGIYGNLMECDVEVERWKSQ